MPSRRGVNFANKFTHSFYTRSLQKHKNSVKSSLSFYPFGIYRRKSCLQNIWWNWHEVLISPTFYVKLFKGKVFFAAFLYLQFGFIIFGLRKLTQKLVVKFWWFLSKDANWPNPCVGENEENWWKKYFDF